MAEDSMGGQDDENSIDLMEWIWTNFSTKMKVQMTTLPSSMSSNLIWEIKGFSPFLGRNGDGKWISYNKIEKEKFSSRPFKAQKIGHV
jgi:hypothetical protein